MRGRGTLLVMLLLGGCATYRPAPLPDAASILDTGEVPSTPPIGHPRLAAAPVDPSAPLGDLDLARLALVSSPDLAATRARVGVAEAQVVAAGRVPDPQLSIAIDRPLGPGLVDALSAGLAFDLATLVTRAPRVAAARAARDQVRFDVAWTEWLAMGQVRTLARRLQSLDAQIQTAARAEAAAKTLYDAMHASMRRGDARLDDVAVYQVGVLDARDRRLGLERQREATRSELDTVLGAPPDAQLTLAPPLPLRPLDALDATRLIHRAAAERLDLAALRSGYIAQERGLQAATRLALPLPQLGLNVARDTGGVRTRGLSVGIGLPLWNRNRGEIAVATATRAQLAAEYRARVLQARGDIAAQLADLRAIDAQRRALLAELPALERTVDVLGAATRNGDVAAPAYESVRAAWLDKTLAAQALEQAQREAEVAFETAVGDWVWK